MPPHKRVSRFGNARSQVLVEFLVLLLYFAVLVGVIVQALG